MNDKEDSEWDEKEYMLYGAIILLFLLFIVVIIFYSKRYCNKLYNEKKGKRSHKAIELGI